jgi:hypothetical protein
MAAYKAIADCRLQIDPTLKAQALRGRILKPVLAFGRAVAPFLLLWGFLAVGGKTDNNKTSSTVLPQAKTTSIWLLRTPC